MKKTAVFRELGGQRIAFKVSNILGLSEFDDHCALTVLSSDKVEVYAVEGSFEDNHRVIEYEERAHLKNLMNPKEPWSEPWKDTK